MDMRIVMVALVALCGFGCDDGSAGDGGAGGVNGEVLVGEPCDFETRCDTPGAVCHELTGVDGWPWQCVVNPVPVGEPCETTDDCGGWDRGGLCLTGEDGAKRCTSQCEYDVGCPAGLVCVAAGNQLCRPPEATP